MAQRVSEEPIAIDFDDVVIRFNQGFLAYHNKMHGTNLIYEVLTTYQMEQLYKCDRDTIVGRVKDFYESDDHASTKPIRGSVRAIRQLRDHYQLHIVTSRPDMAKNATLTWIARYFPNTFHQIHFTNGFGGEEGTTQIKKSVICRQIGAATLIEDAPHHAKESSADGIRVIMPDRPWNRSETPSSIIRTHSWDEILYHLGVR